MRVRHLALLWLVGIVAIGGATWACFALGVNLGITGFVFLIIIVLLSLWDSFISSAVFSVVGVAALNYFFAQPLFTFHVDSGQDIILLATFVLTSFVITGQVRRLRLATMTLQRQAQLIELTHDTMLVRDSRDAITFWNRGAEQLYGWSREDALGKVAGALLKTVYPESRDVIENTVRKAGHWEGELVNTRKDGSKVIVASRWSLHRDEAGQPAGTLETNNDITDRKRAEDALRRSQAAYLAEAQKLSLTGSFGWDTVSGDVFWSDQTYAILGYESEVKPSTAAMLARVHPDDLELMRQAIGPVANDRSEIDLEFRLCLADGTIKYAHAVAHAVETAPFQVQFVGALMDVTAARQSETRLQQAHAQVAHVARVTSLGVLSASIAHEVNQPLAAVASHSEAGLRWLRRDPPRLDEVEASIRQVIANSKRAGEIVQRVRALTTKSSQQAQPLNINELVAEVIPLVRSEANRSQAQLRLELGADLPAILGDSIQLEQVIINLIVNAVQAMATIEGRPRVVTISSRANADGGVVLAVADTGPGIDPAHAIELFDAFFTTKPGGMGMGLSICRSIIEAHGGTISALPRGDGPGAVFRCVLPAHAMS